MQCFGWIVWCWGVDWVQVWCCSGCWSCSLVCGGGLLGGSLLLFLFGFVVGCSLVFSFLVFVVVVGGVLLSCDLFGCVGFFGMLFGQVLLFGLLFVVVFGVFFCFFGFGFGVFGCVLNVFGQVVFQVWQGWSGCIYFFDQCYQVLCFGVVFVVQVLFGGDQGVWQQIGQCVFY